MTSEKKIPKNLCTHYEENNFKMCSIFSAKLYPISICLDGQKYKYIWIISIQCRFQHLIKKQLWWRSKSIWHLRTIWIIYGMWYFKGGMAGWGQGTHTSESYVLYVVLFSWQLFKKTWWCDLFFFFYYTCFSLCPPKSKITEIVFYSRSRFGTWVPDHQVKY